MFLVIAIVVIIGILICVKIVTKIAKKVYDVDEYEIDFEERTKGQFVGRFDTDSFDLKNHSD